MTSARHHASLRDEGLNRFDPGATGLVVLHISSVARCPPSGLQARRKRDRYREPLALGLHWITSMSEIDAKTLRNAYEKARDDLLSERNRFRSLGRSTLVIRPVYGHRGQRPGDRRPCDRPRVTIQRQIVCQEMIEAGLACLARRQNPDGGWGDTDKSHSNIATTMLVRRRVSAWPAATIDIGRSAVASRGRTSTHRAASPACGGDTAKTRRSPCRS